MGTEKIVNQMRSFACNGNDICIDFSGGKYSLVLLHLAHRAFKEVKAVYVDTTQTIPECDEYVKKISDEWGTELTIIKREDMNFWSLVERKGFPHVRFRWCMKELKSIPLRLFNESNGNNYLHFTGTNIGRSSERKKIYDIRGAYHFNHHIGSYVFHPLLGWNDQMVDEYVEKYGLQVNSCYSIYGQGGNCYYCPYIKRKEYYLKLAKFHPKLFDNIVKAEKGMINKGAAIYLGEGKLLHVSKLL
jgi:3'-phosphoadenosine 5'-phosphosulfate sulfotransferase (PAPS reductase)/FAD synthetase